MSKNAFKAYANATMTVAPTRQVVMLYDAAIRNIQKAKEAIEKRDIETRYKNLIKAGEIIFGLQGALDFDNGGEVANVLYQFYSSVDARILSIHRSNSAETCEQIIKELKMMRDSWAEIDSDRNGGVTMPQTAPEFLPHNPENGSSGLAISV